MHRLSRRSPSRRGSSAPASPRWPRRRSATRRRPRGPRRPRARGKLRVRVLGARAVVEQNDGPDAREHDVLARLRAQTGEAGDEKRRLAELRYASTPHTRSWRSYTARCSAVSSSPRRRPPSRGFGKPPGALCLVRSRSDRDDDRQRREKHAVRFSRAFLAVGGSSRPKSKTRAAPAPSTRQRRRTYLYTRGQAAPPSVAYSPPLFPWRAPRPP